MKDFSFISFIVTVVFFLAIVAGILSALGFIAIPLPKIVVGLFATVATTTVLQLVRSFFSK